jgi:two-component sensor histidine kinase
MPISGKFVIQSTVAFLTVGFLVLFGIVGATIWLGERARFYADDAIAAQDIRRAAVELRSAVQSAEASQRGYLVGGNEVYLAPYDSAKTTLLRQFDLLKQSLASDGDAQPMLQRLSMVIDDKIREMDNTISLKSNNRGDDALGLFRTNRGKALMDEANVFLSAILRSSDERIATDVAIQQANADWLRWVSTIGGLIIIVVVGGAALTILLYAREVVQARDEISAANINLENRVIARTADLGRARDRAEALVTEVNHRVANSLQLVAALVRMQANAVKDGAARNALDETEARIFAVASVHKRLYSSGDARLVEMNEYLSGLLGHLEISMKAEGHGASLRHQLQPLQLTTDAAINLGVVTAEWVTNAFKYAYPEQAGEVRVRLSKLADGQAELVVEDDGVGRHDHGFAQGTGLGTTIVKAMAQTLHATVKYDDRERGTAARIVFPLQAA